MPRAAPIVRSKRYEHAIAALVAKRSEIAGQIKFKGADLAGQLVHIDAVLAILGYKGDPSQIRPLKRHTIRFRRGELWRLVQKFEAEGSKANKETAQRIVAFKGWDAALVEPVRQGVNSAKVKRRRIAAASASDA